MSTTHPTDISIARHRTHPETYDERAARVARERALGRYVEAYGEPPGDEWAPSTIAHLDACDRIECGCTSTRAWFCSTAVGVRDGRCGCECHPDERSR